MRLLQLTQSGRLQCQDFSNRAASRTSALSLSGLQAAGGCGQRQNHEHRAHHVAFVDVLHAVMWCSVVPNCHALPLTVVYEHTLAPLAAFVYTYYTVMEPRPRNVFIEKHQRHL